MSVSAQQQRANDVALLLVRAILAAVFILHGGQKLFGWFGGHGIAGTSGYLASLGIPLPTLGAAAAGATEFFGGLFLLVGTGTRLAALPMAATMFVAAFTAHSGFDILKGGMEYPLTLAIVLVALSLLGPGRLTLGLLVGAEGRKGTTSVAASA